MGVGWGIADALPQPPAAFIKKDEYPSLEPTLEAHQ